MPKFNILDMLKFRSNSKEGYPDHTHRQTGTNTGNCKASTSVGNLKKKNLPRSLVKIKIKLKKTQEFLL